MTTPLQQALKYWLSDLYHFSRLILQRPLREYQLLPARAILNSILHNQGLTFAVMMARQAGKNELSGQLEAYLLNLYRRRGGQIVKASPTFKPQTLNSILRLTDRLNNPWNTGQWKRREGYMIELDTARALFFSAGPSANVVGATASLLLEGDEAQDIDPTKWAKDFRPMGASTNATTVLWGTAWTSGTLLNRTIALLRSQTAHDGRQRVFLADADVVALEVPHYGAYVQSEVARLGRQHPLIRTQYYLEVIDAEGKYLNPDILSLLHGDHPRQPEPQPGRRYAFLLDVAGEDEAAGTAIERAMLENPKRDATALTIVEYDLRAGAPPLYRIVNRRLWLGTPHAALYDILMTLYHQWRPSHLIVDATGVGAGLASFLRRAIDHTETPAHEPGQTVIPVEFSSVVKSDLGWGLLGILTTGRCRDYLHDHAPETRQFWYEAESAEKEILPGPSKTLRWGVWETPAYDGLIAHGHDDLLVSLSLLTVLERHLPTWTNVESFTVPTPDPMEDIDAASW